MDTMVQMTDVTLKREYLKGWGQGVNLETVCGWIWTWISQGRAGVRGLVCFPFPTARIKIWPFLLDFLQSSLKTPRPAHAVLWYLSSSNILNIVWPWESSSLLHHPSGVLASVQLCPAPSTSTHQHSSGTFHHLVSVQRAPPAQSITPTPGYNSVCP